jgi:hypothetical protein
VSAPTPPRPSRPRSVRARSGAVLPTLALLGLGALACAPQEQATDAAHLLLTNARVYTLDWGEPGPTGTPAADAPWSEATGWSPDAGAVAIRDGRIIFVGSPEEAEAYRGSDTRVMDLAGATVIPGLVESHSHLLSLGNTLFQVDLVGVQTHEEAIRRVEERAATVPPGSWIVGRGWDEGAWANQYPDRVLLSRRIPDHPVWLRGSTASLDGPTTGRCRRRGSPGIRNPRWAARSAGGPTESPPDSS